jgi:multiple sugar transport system permease protein
MNRLLGPVAAPLTHRRAWGRNVAYRLQLWALLLPYVLGALLLVVLPALIALGLAFTRYNALTPPVWVGLRNFRLLQADLRFPIALQNSLYFVALAVPLRLLAALALALLLNRARRGVGLYRAAVYLPTVIPDVAYALVWLWILNPLYGPLNLLLSAVGLPAPAWLADAQTAKPALVLMSLFQIGEGFVLLLAGLRSIPADCYAAAAVDGGSRWQMFRYITLPLLWPWLALLTFRDLILNLHSTFTPAFLMTGGDPYYATLFLPLLAYEEAFDGFRFGQGFALMLILFGVTALLMLAFFGLFARRGYGDEL